MNAFLSEIIKRPHPAIVHLPMSLYPLSTLFLVLFLIQGNVQFLIVAYWCYMLGCIAILPVSLTGLADFIRLKPHSPKAHGYLIAHLINGVLITMMGIATGLFFWQHSPLEEDRLRSFLTCSVILSGLVMAQGAIAAVMVYQHKLGVDGETR